MGSVYSLSLFDGVVTGGGASHDLWTVPAGYLEVIRDIEAYTSAGVADQAFFGLATNRWLWLLLAAAGPSSHWSGRAVHSAGDTLTLYIVTGPIHLKVSGYRFAVP